MIKLNTNNIHKIKYAKPSQIKYMMTLIFILFFYTSGEKGGKSAEHIYNIQDMLYHNMCENNNPTHLSSQHIHTYPSPLIPPHPGVYENVEQPHTDDIEPDQQGSLSEWYCFGSEFFGEYASDIGLYKTIPLDSLVHDMVSGIDTSSRKDYYRNKVHNDIRTEYRDQNYISHKHEINEALKRFDIPEEYYYKIYRDISAIFYQYMMKQNPHNDSLYILAPHIFDHLCSRELSCEIENNMISNYLQRLVIGYQSVFKKTGYPSQAILADGKDVLPPHYDIEDIDITYHRLTAQECIKGLEKLGITIASSREGTHAHGEYYGYYDTYLGGIDQRVLDFLEKLQENIKAQYNLQKVPLIIRGGREYSHSGSRFFEHTSQHPGWIRKEYLDNGTIKDKYLHKIVYSHLFGFTIDISSRGKMGAILSDYFGIWTDARHRNQDKVILKYHDITVNVWYHAQHFHVTILPQKLYDRLEIKHSTIDDDIQEDVFDTLSINPVIDGKAYEKSDSNTTTIDTLAINGHNNSHDSTKFVTKDTITDDSKIASSDSINIGKPIPILIDSLPVIDDIPQ